MAEPKIDDYLKTKPEIKIDLSTLGGHLWEAANILRSSVDRSDFKTYIFPLLFFKRISDVYDEELDEALRTSKGDLDYAEFAENHRFQIPDGSHWMDIRQVTTNVGQALQQALHEIEKSNPSKLYGIFGDAQWTNKERFSDALLRDLIEHFSKLPMRNSNVQTDIMGQSYEYLIKKFADVAKKKAGEFYTPRAIVSLMVKILDPKEGETIYDPACGTGGMLLGAVQHVLESKGEVKTLWGRLYGQEKNLTTSSISRMNLLLHGIDEFQIEHEDTLRQPAFFSGDNLSTYDCVIANPPFSLKEWGREIWTNDPFGRNFAGLPPKSYADFAWIQHMISSMRSETGRMAVVVPQGVLFRGSSEGRIRQKILEMDILDAVIGVGPNLFYGSGITPAILVFRKKKVSEKKGKILMIDASKLFWSGRAQNELHQEHIEEIFRCYLGWKDVERISKVITIEELANEEWNLNISRYVSNVVEEEIIPLSEAIKNLRIGLDEAYESEKNLRKLLRHSDVMQ